MTAAAKNTFGTVLKLAVSPGTPAAIAELTNISDSGMTRATIDATTHDGSQAMEFIADGVYDPGEITFEGNLIAGSIADDLLRDAVQNGSLMLGEIENLKAASGAEQRTFSGYITSYSIGEYPVAGGKQTFSATMKISGAITQAV
jgi:hypothetical protein